MRIVPQDALNAYSQVPEIPLLAPPPIVGLLPAYIPAKVEIVQHQPYRQGSTKSFPSRDSSRVVYRSFAEWRAADEELMAFFEASRRRIDAAYQRYHDRQRAQAHREVKHG